MSARTSIEWTDRTWNPVRGCSVVSAGCKNCYAMKVGARFSGPGLAYEGLALRSPARWTGTVRLVEEDLLEPLFWRRPRRIFVNSMADLFHEGLPDEVIDRVFAVMALAPWHTFQILTKRAERMRAYIASRLDGRAWTKAIERLPRRVILRSNIAGVDRGWWPRYTDNIWLGVSVEDQRAADERIPLLLQTPAAVRFLSVEPLLGPVDFNEVPMEDRCYGVLGSGGGLPGVDWVIVGGESGPRARPCDVAWIRATVRSCRKAGVPVFVKQVGAAPVGPDDCLRCAGTGLLGEVAGPENDRLPRLRCGHCLGTGREAAGLADRKGGDPAEWPKDLRVREFPEVVRG